MFNFGFVIVSANWLVTSARGDYNGTSHSKFSEAPWLVAQGHAPAQMEGIDSLKDVTGRYLLAQWTNKTNSLCAHAKRKVLFGMWNLLPLCTTSFLPNAKNNSYRASACCKQKIKHYHKWKIQLFTSDDLLQLPPCVSFHFLMLLLHWVILLGS